MQLPGFCTLAPGNLEGMCERGFRGMAPWQVRRVTTHIEANLDGTIGVKTLAELVQLSPFPFCRAFRDSFGQSP
jgi:AraC-like DNA-binding protein